MRRIYERQLWSALLLALALTSAATGRVLAQTASKLKVRRLHR
jgi:hypothetical protein